MKINKILITGLLVGFCAFATAQDDLLNQLDTIKSNEKEIETAAFKGLQVCNMQSTKMAAKGELYILITHRFGDLTNGFDNFFGLDNANARLGTVYGATNWLSLGFSRHTYNKIYDFNAKYKLANQEKNGFPVTIVGYNNLEINSLLKKINFPDLTFSSRLAFSTQLLVSKKFCEKFSMQIAPIYIFKNFYDTLNERQNNFIIASGARMKITKRMSVNLEYAAQIPGALGTIYRNTATVGLDIETGGHVFQLLFSNNQAMSDVAVFTNSTGNLVDKGIYFGFNLYRVFN